MKKKRTIRQDNPTIEEGEKLLKLANLLPEEIMTLHELGAATNALTLPDRFNSAFTKTGWVFVEFCTGAMPAVKALEMHNNGKSEIEIDQYLADNLFNFQALKFQLSKWIGKGVVEPERPEALKVFNRAFHAFEEEDYIVAVPLFLMLVDGLSLSMTGTKSIFSNLEEMDHLFELNTSIGGHGSALKEAVKTMVIAQKGYSEESLSAPLRHGILHGTRLNYANKVVAVKALCIFGALIELLRDSQAPSKRDIKKEKTNLQILESNLGRIKPLTPDDAFNALVFSIENQKVSEIVALLDYDPKLTNFLEYMKRWQNLILEYEFDIVRIGEWTMFGDDTDTEQYAVCEFHVKIFRSANKDFYEFKNKISAKCSNEIYQLLGVKYWQVGQEILGELNREIELYKNIKN